MLHRKAAFYFSEREKRERQRRQETNRTAVRSMPITQAGDRGRTPGFWQTPARQANTTAGDTLNMVAGWCKEASSGTSLPGR
ncbi:hypothetical protein NUKP48_51350 [Klebsiella quasipneumoniae]|nr:hypothetical protein NUKP48_51350 [Klebsiella quasipneumoniae]GKQ16671.1 hypothetical protein NUKP108_51410 [Klebsiella quasipneumoniae]